MIELWPHCKSLKCHSAFASVPEASPILSKTRNMGSLKLLSNMPFKQHLSSTTGRETFASKVCLRENGGRWLTGCTTGRKRPNNCWGVKVQKFFSFFSPFPLGKESFQGPEIVRCYFSSAFFEAQGNLKGHRYSSLVTILFQNWGLFRCCAPFRPPGILCFVLHESHRVYWLRWNCKSFFFFFLFFYSELPPPPFFTRRSFSLAVKCRSTPYD